MNKRYIIMLDSSTKKQSIALGQIIERMGFSWWHWFQNHWLISGKFKDFSMDDIRKVIQDTHPGVDFLIIEIQGNQDGWLGVTFGKRKIFEWLDENWNE